MPRNLGHRARNHPGNDRDGSGDGRQHQNRRLTVQSEPKRLKPFLVPDKNIPDTEHNARNCEGDQRSRLNELFKFEPGIRQHKRRTKADNQSEYRGCSRNRQ
ncbi:hypothetical protein D3C76_1548970 [compost metagenome]